MKKIIISLLTGLSATAVAHAQGHRLCGAMHVQQYMAGQHAVFVQEHLPPDAGPLLSNAKSTNATDTIPVVFHIVLTTAQQANLAYGGGIEERVQSQIDVLNADYAGMNADSNLIPAVFKPLFGHSSIRFGLAHTAPGGLSTPGYEVITTQQQSYKLYNNTYGSHYFFSDASYDAAGVPNAWNTGQYLNVWVINPGTDATGILGLTKPPTDIGFGGYPAEEKGIYINYAAFGKRTSINQQFIPGIDGGRTLTHELGHFFDINHIWGDNNDCVQDDGIGDTPLQGNENYNCPTFPATSCSLAESPHGDMFMDYMDYVDDACMMMFSLGQVAHMQSQTQTSGLSYNLTTHNELLHYPTAVNKLSGASAAVYVSPNPTTGKITIRLEPQAVLQSYTVTNTLGQVVVSGTSHGTVENIDLTGNSTGIYFIHCLINGSVVTKKIVLQ